MLIALKHQRVGASSGLHTVETGSCIRRSSIYLARLAFSISLAACGSTFRPLDACRER
jgi:hypothetical protein